jgi:hypothetical protein
MAQAALATTRSKLARGGSSPDGPTAGGPAGPGGGGGGNAPSSVGKLPPPAGPPALDFSFQVRSADAAR